MKILLLIDAVWALYMASIWEKIGYLNLFFKLVYLILGIMNLYYWLH